MNRRIIYFLLILLSVNAKSQQHIGQWKTFTDMKSVLSSVRVDNNIWATTSSGVFVYNMVSEQYKKFDISNGLSSDDVRCIAVETGKRIWVGGANGFINTFDLQTEEWSTIDANRPNDDSQKGVQGFSLKGDTMLVATKFGVVPFKISKWEFGDTYASFGFSSAPVVKCVLTDASYIYVGTDKGLAIAPLAAPNLSAPDSWTVYSTISEISSDPISIMTLTVLRDTLAIATDKGAGYYKNGSFGAVGALRGKSIQDIRISGGKLLILRNEGSGFIVESLSSFTETPQLVDSNTTVQGSSLIPVSSSLWISTASNGLTRRMASEWNYYYPNGPKSNLFSSLVVDDDGVLWAASGSNSYAGFYRYDPSLPENTQWKNFPGIFFYLVSLGAKGSVWVSSWGFGVVKVVGDSIQNTLNYYSSPSLPGANSELATYVVTGSVAVDPQGKTWISNRVDGSGRSLLRLDSDTSATFFDNQFSPSDGWFHPMVIDHNGTKWLAGDLPWIVKRPQSGLNGAYVFNENTVLSGIYTVNGWGHLSSSDGLKSDVVLAFAVDLDGAVWIGTSKGVTIVPDPEFPKQQSICYALQAYAPFVQTIAVDALNNKWIGTNDGVFVVNSDGTQLLQSYKAASTDGQLLSDDVRSIAIDQKRGIAYFGTEQGLSSLAIEAVQTNQSYSKLDVGPNPFILPNEQRLTIRNLVAGSTIKILTVSGFVVAQFEAQGGGRAFWDGRDKNGAFVSSGIYFIVAFAENGSQTVTGKVAVIRR